MTETGTGATPPTMVNPAGYVYIIQNFIIPIPTARGQQLPPPLVPPQEHKSAVVYVAQPKHKLPLPLGTIILPLGLLTSPPLAPPQEANHDIAQGVQQKLM